MIDIDLNAYFGLPDEQKQQIRQLILDDLEQAPKGLKQYYQNCHNDVDEMLRRMYRGYLGELSILRHLQRLNPSQDGRFVDDKAGYYHLNYQHNSQPDLINNCGITIEVKSYKFYNDIVYFNGYQTNIDSLGEGLFHNADNVIVYYNNKAVMFNYDYFKDNVSTEPDQLNKYKTIFKLNISGLKQVDIISF